MIIAMTGKKRSGKDTGGSYLVKNYGFTKYAFAQPIKDMCRIIFLWDERHEEGDLKEVVDPFWGISPREAYQTIGTELFRERFPELHEKFRYLINKDIWVKRFEKWYSLNNDKNVVITDLRFLNEAGIIKDLGGYIIKVKSPVESNDTHLSEMEMEKIIPHYKIDNEDYEVSFIEESMEIIHGELNEKA